MGNLDVMPDHIGQQSPPHTSDKLEVQYYVLHSFYLIILIHFGRLSFVGFLLFQLPMMLVMQHRCAVDMSDIIGLGLMFHHLEHTHCELKILCYQGRNLLPPVSNLPAQ